jgi:RimJ/RimL family protein N-acetyltransferase
MEFFLRDDAQDLASEAFDLLVSESGATEFEAQTNITPMNTLLEKKCVDIKDENLLFCSGSDSGAFKDTARMFDERTFRHRRAGDTGPDGAWVVEINKRVVAAGGFLRHYNPPFGDIFMEVIPEYRRQGIGSYLVFKLRQHAAEVGIEPAARCDADNDASKRTLEKGGMTCCGRLRSGKIRLTTSE